MTNSAESADFAPKKAPWRVIYMFLEVRRDGKQVTMRKCKMTTTPNDRPFMWERVINGFPRKVYPTDVLLGEEVTVMLNDKNKPVIDSFTACPPSSSVYGKASWQSVCQCASKTAQVVCDKRKRCDEKCDCV